MQRSEVGATAVLAIVLMSYTMIVLDIWIVIVAPDRPASQDSRRCRR
jgi:hypothetical protein